MNWIIYIISCVVDIFVLYVLFGSILEERRENIPLGFVFAGMFVQQLITTVVSQNVENPFANLGVQAVSCFLLTLFYYSGWIWRVVTAAVFLTIAVLSEGIAIAVAEQVGVKNIEQLHDPMLLLAELFMLLLAMLTRVFGRNKGNISRRYQLGYCVIPAISVALACGMGVLDDTATWLFAMAGLLIINMVCYYIMNYLIVSVNRVNREEAMEEQMKQQKEKYRQLYEMYNERNGIVHDVNKQRRLLLQYLENGQVEQAIDNLMRMDEDFRKTYTIAQTGNIVVDFFLGKLKTDIEKLQGVCKIETDIVCDELPIEDYDMVVLLGNIVENIVEAVSVIQNPEDRKVKVRIAQSENEFTLYAVNTMDESGKKIKKGPYHGYGIRNIKKVIKKYGGVEKIGPKDGKFQVNIFINWRENAGDNKQKNNGTLDS